jgi:Zn finger protein HypA/HybF involved in hydrogenase expression
MYLREKRILVFKIFNVIFAVITIANLLLSVSYEIYLAVRYPSDPFTMMHARNTQDFIFWIIAGPIILIHLYRSRSRIEDATFYSGYFEGDLDGIVSAEDLSEVTGKTPEKIKKQLKRFPKIYMKNYTYKDGSAELSSKIVTCDCLSCGGVFEKKLYFTGECPYCGSSDLQARILTDGKFYSISNELKGKPKSYSYYTAKSLNAKKGLFPLLMGLCIF